MISAATVPELSALAKALAAKAEMIARARAETIARERRSDPARWRQARLLWPLLTKG